MITVKFTKNPAGDLWIGWTEYENGTWFASGRTLDMLVKRMKVRLWTDKHVSMRQVYLDTNKSNITDVPVDKMTKVFRTKFWRDYQRTAEQSLEQKPVEKPAEQKVFSRDLGEVKYDYYEYKVKDGHLVVYGILRREINSFDLRKNNEGGNDGTNEQ